MTVAVMRNLDDYGFSPKSTADKGLGYVSDAVKILKIIGAALDLLLDETTFRDLMIEARHVIAASQPNTIANQ